MLNSKCKTLLYWKRKTTLKQFCVAQFRDLSWKATLCGGYAEMIAEWNVAAETIATECWNHLCWADFAW